MRYDEDNVAVFEATLQYFLGQYPSIFQPILLYIARHIVSTFMESNLHREALGLPTTPNPILSILTSSFIKIRSFLFANFAYPTSWDGDRRHTGGRGYNISDIMNVMTSDRSSIGLDRCPFHIKSNLPVNYSNKSSNSNSGSSKHDSSLSSSGNSNNNNNNNSTTKCNSISNNSSTINNNSISNSNSNSNSASCSFDPLSIDDSRLPLNHIYFPNEPLEFGNDLYTPLSSGQIDRLREIEREGERRRREGELEKDNSNSNSKYANSSREVRGYVIEAMGPRGIPKGRLERLPNYKGRYEPIL